MGPDVAPPIAIGRSSPRSPPSSRYSGRDGWRLAPLPPACGGRSQAVLAAEQAIEVREVAETRVIGGLVDLARCARLAAQQRERPLEPKLLHAFGEARPGFVEEFMQIARRDSQPHGDLRRRYLGIGVGGPDQTQCCLEPRRAQSAR